MSKIKRVPIEQLGEYLEGTTEIAVEKDGKVVGFYRPKARDKVTVQAKNLDWSKTRPGSREAAERLRQTLQQIYEAAGLTEDEFVDLMNPKIEFPSDRFGEKGES